MTSERPARVPGAVVWTSTGTAGGPVLPDGCMDVIWLGDGLVVAGPDSRAFPAPEVRGGAVGVRFPPGTAPALLGVAAHELRDQRVPLVDLWGGAGRDLDEQVAASPDRADALERWAMRAWRDATVDPRSGVAAAALGRGAPVGSVADRLGLSPRQLHRRSLDWYGYGPKVLARVLRFQRALRLLDDGRSAASAATEAGYADQPHLAREVRALAGTTLGALRG